MPSPRTAPDLDRCFYFPIERIAARTQLQLRLGAARNNQRSGRQLGRRLRVRGATICALWGRSSAGRASAWQAEGQGFEPPRLHSVRRCVSLDGRAARVEPSERLRKPTPSPPPRCRVPPPDATLARPLPAAGLVALGKGSGDPGSCKSVRTRRSIVRRSAEVDRRRPRGGGRGPCCDHAGRFSDADGSRRRDRWRTMIPAGVSV